MHGLDIPLRPAAVANRSARRHKPLRQGGLADILARPELLEQFLLGHHAVSMRNEVRQDLEPLGLKRAERASQTQFITPQIKLECLKDVDHATPLSSALDRPRLCEAAVCTRGMIIPELPVDETVLRLFCNCCEMVLQSSRPSA